MEIAGAASPRPPPESHMAAPHPPPQSPEKDLCEDRGDMRVTREKPCTHQELDIDQTNSSSLNHYSECENQTHNNDEISGSESNLEIAKNEGDVPSGEKVLKKPDKILPCPRCNSMDTKFCYYNNYNIKQPRHFCKSCQRYWTAGGSMRNIPLGAGRRKSKNSSANSRSILILGSSIATPGGEASLFPLSIKGNQAAVSFGPHSPLCNSMASVLKIGGEQIMSSNPALAAQLKNGENQTCPPSTTSSDGPGKESQKEQRVHIKMELLGKAMESLQCILYHSSLVRLLCTHGVLHGMAFPPWQQRCAQPQRKQQILQKMAPQAVIFNGMCHQLCMYCHRDSAVQFQFR